MSHRPFDLWSRWRETGPRRAPPGHASEAQRAASPEAAESVIEAFVQRRRSISSPAASLEGLRPLSDGDLLHA